ncbi:hypothetical protein E2C01_082175 [Portunus trituberculatus]|uniref:Uncharacterized protein n=1 Tax=Portunus trituberculatus TaxID=210409 RepID=A0A5B7J0W0_PORTR|nr:hypothetical protein [Portunus trituberculatus]
MLSIVTSFLQHPPPSQPPPSPPQDATHYPRSEALDIRTPTSHTPRPPPAPNVSPGPAQYCT